MEERLANAPEGFEGELAQAYARQLHPYLLAKRAALAAGGLSGLVLGGFFLNKRLRPKAPLAQEGESC